MHCYFQMGQKLFRFIGAGELFSGIAEKGTVSRACEKSL